MQLFLRKLVPKKIVFLTTLGVCCPKSSGRKAVKFGRNMYFHQYHSLTKRYLVLKGQGWKCLSYVLSWCEMTHSVVK
jgi:hypothetical protein